jgi:hypothetical protein
MKIPTDESGISGWLEICKNTLSEIEPHHIRRVGLMAIAFSGKSFSGKSDGFSANDYSDEKAASLFEAANAGDADADSALCIIASLLLGRGVQIPRRLADYISKVLGDRGFAKARRRRGRFSTYDKLKRNLPLIRLIEAVRDTHGSPVTRGDGDKEDETAEPSKKISVCSFLAPLVGLSEGTLEDIWTNRGQFRLD